MFSLDSIRQTILSHLIEVNFAFMESLKTVLSFLFPSPLPYFKPLMPRLRPCFSALADIVQVLAAGEKGRM